MIDAGQVGVSLVRRLGPGLPLRRARAGRSASSPRTSSGSCSSSSSSTPTARSRPTSGSSPTSTRRCTPGRSGASTTWTASAPARPTATSWSAASTSCCINFTWWINKVDREGNNIFEGGFLGLDNITVVDRSEPLPDGAVLEQSDATGWMGMFCLNLMRIALELAKENRVYEALATKFFQHYAYVAAAMKHMGSRDYQLWDEQDGFFYDVLRYPDGRFRKFRVRSLVGLIPLFAVERLERDVDRAVHGVPGEPATGSSRTARTWSSDVVHTVERDGAGDARADDRRPATSCAACSSGVWDPDEFLSRLRHPQPLEGPRGAPVRVRRPRRSATSRPSRSSKIKGGNSNWRGPIWFPTRFLLIESLRKLGTAFGADVDRRAAGDRRRRRSPSASMARRARRPPDRASSRATPTAGARSTATPRRSRTTRTGAT